MFRKKNKKEENNKEEASKAQDTKEEASKTQAPKEEISKAQAPKAETPIAVTLKASNSNETPKEEKKVPQKQKLAMVPLFSWRTIIVAGIGVIAGAILGILYYIIAPSLSSSGVNLEEPQQQSGGLLSSFGPASSGPWQSEVNVEILNPGLSEMNSIEIVNMGEFYTARANSLPFLEYLSNELNDEDPEYRYSVNQLAQMVSADFDISRETPVMEFRAVASTVEETTFLIAFVPAAFKDFLVSESIAEHEQEYQNTLESIDDIKTAILEAEEELRLLGPQGAASDIQNSPDYIALNAKIESLESELDAQADELALLIASGDGDGQTNVIEQEYQKVLQQTRDTSIALNEAEQKLQDIIEQNSDYTSVTSNPEYIILDAKIRALERQLDLLMNGDVNVVGLASMIADGDTSSSVYNLTMEKVETVGAALSEARAEIASLESQAGSIEDNLDYQLAQAEIDTLTQELTDLRERLTILARRSVELGTETDTQASFERTSAALADARKALAILVSQSGGEYYEIDLEYQLVQDKINNLNAELSVLNNRLGALLVTNTEVSELVEYLSIRNAEIPTPVVSISLRISLMIGAVFGIALAWVILNFRWLTKGFSSSAEEEDEGEE